VINVLLPLSFASSLALSLPSWLFAIPCAGLALIHAPALWTRVPYYPTSREAYPLILAELPPGERFTFIDIGCGCGDLLLFLQRHRPLGEYYGVEIGVLPYLVSKTKAFICGRGAISIHFQNIKRTRLQDFDFVYAFLSPAAMTMVWQKASREMKPGSTFITNSFEVPAEATYAITIKDTRGGSLFVHKMADQRVEHAYAEIS
jgi:precorrin-6B methylase 2